MVLNIGQKRDLQVLISPPLNPARLCDKSEKKKILRCHVYGNVTDNQPKSMPAATGVTRVEAQKDHIVLTSLSLC